LQQIFNHEHPFNDMTLLVRSSLPRFWIADREFTLVNRQDDVLPKLTHQKTLACV
jgi:hypothetical protein